jgi:FlaA1/EpsC-like NDP-sugar epimerase
VIPINRHRLWQLLADAVLIAIAWWLAFWLRFDKGVPGPYHRLMIDTILVVIAIKLAAFIAFGFYNRWWRYVSTRDMWGAARGGSPAGIVGGIGV